ncbi:hypothetical protein [Bacillus paranthracis]|nr:hypothetical protein [Bacillus paranthracis]
MVEEFEKQAKKLIGATVKEVSGTTIYFSNGMEMSVHPYETYIEDYSEEE